MTGWSGHRGSGAGTEMVEPVLELVWALGVVTKTDRLADLVARLMGPDLWVSSLVATFCDSHGDPVVEARFDGQTWQIHPAGSDG